MDSIREIAEQVGSFADSSDEARGWTLLASAGAAIGGSLWAWMRRKPISTGTVVNATVPVGESLEVRVGKD